MKEYILSKSDGDSLHICWHPEIVEVNKKVNVISGNVSYDGMTMRCDFVRSSKRMCGAYGAKFKQYDGEKKMIEKVEGMLWWKRPTRILADKRLVYGHPTTVDAIYFPCSYD
jgi:hypothetical protein